MVLAAPPHGYLGRALLLTDELSLACLSRFVCHFSSRNLIMFKRAILTTLCACVAGFPVCNAQVVVYENDYEGETIGGGFPAWNWGGGGADHTATFADYDGNIVVEHRSNVVGTGAADNRFGSKWDLTLSGNTSTDPSRYTVSFDIRNVQGGWDPIDLQLFVVTEEQSGSDDNGYGAAAASFSQADGWVHVEYNLADLNVGWWQGQEWVLNKQRWSLEVGMPWPGLEVATGTTFEQVWLMDNLKIEMQLPPMVDLTLVVNKDTNEIKIRNDSGVPVSLDYYSIESAQSALDPAGWNSLDDQNYDAGVPTDYSNDGIVDGADLGVWQSSYGVDDMADANGDGQSNGSDFLAWQTNLGALPTAADGWIEGGGANASVLGELFLNGASTLGPGEEVSLGAAYDSSVFGTADGDLEFHVSTGESTTLGMGAVVYETGAVAGPVPEPSTFALGIATGVALLSLRRRSGV